MKILFVSLSEISSIYQHGLYSDLLREFAKNKHSITIISPVERRTGRKGEVIKHENIQIIKVRIGNIQKTNYIEKGISLLLLSTQLIRAIKKNCPDMKFDLLLYATPPITIYRLIKKLKSITKAKTFLMLKDIWPQEIVDLELIRSGGILHRYFADLERKMYEISDRIGYTSEASKKYLINYGIADSKLVEVNNSVDPNYQHKNSFDKFELLKKYGVEERQVVFFYGGNLGKPQDIDFVVDCLKSQVNMKDRFFIICGNGTEYYKIKQFFISEQPSNMKLFAYLPKEDYDKLVMLADVGLIFLNHKFTVPNCPTRFYTYMEYGKAVFACTDKASDISNDIYQGGFGWWCESTSISEFERIINEICKIGKKNLEEKGKLARRYLEERYTVDKDYNRILNSIIEVSSCSHN